MNKAVDTLNSKENRPFWERWSETIKVFLLRITPMFVINAFHRFDRRVDGALSFFMKHWGKTPFMISMSKKVQYLGIEKLWNKGPKAFIYFFLFYLVRDTILYIIIPIFFAKLTTS